MDRKILYGILFFVIGLFVSLIALLVISNKLNANLGSGPLFLLTFVGAILFSIIGIKNSDFKESTYVGIASAILGLFIAISISSFAARLVYKLTPNLIDQHIAIYFLVLIIIWVIGAILGQKIGSHLHNNSQSGSTNLNNSSNRFFTWFSYANKRVEGSNIIYEVDKKRYAYLFVLLVVINGLLYLTHTQYQIIIGFVMLFYIFIGEYSKWNDGFRAKSKKIVINQNGLIEYWYQMI